MKIDKIIKIRINEKYEKGKTDKEIGEIYGLSQQMINAIRNGKRNPNSLRLQTVSKILPELSDFDPDTFLKDNLIVTSNQTGNNSIISQIKGEKVITGKTDPGSKFVSLDTIMADESIPAETLIKIYNKYNK